MLDKLAKSFSGCVYMYVHVLWRLLASPLPVVCCLLSPDPPTPPVNGCSHTTSPPHTTVDERLAGAKLIGVLSPFKRTWTQFACNGFNFLASPNLPSFFLRIFFIFFLPTLPGGPSFHFITLCESTCPLRLLFILRQRSACVFVSTCVCVCLHICVYWEDRNLSPGPSIEPLQGKNAYMFMQTPAIIISKYVYYSDIQKRFPSILWVFFFFFFKPGNTILKSA